MRKQEPKEERNGIKQEQNINKTRKVAKKAPNIKQERKGNEDIPINKQKRTTKQKVNVEEERKLTKREKKKIEKKRKKQEKKERRKKSKAWKIFKWFMIIVIIALLIGTANFIYRFAKNGWGLQGFIATAMGHDENTLKDLEPINFLLVGISGCEEDYKLADTIMVCSYNPKTQKASILSIPRDTYVGKDKQKATASYKINAVYRNGENIQGMVQAIEKITDLEISNYFIIDTDALTNKHEI